MDHVRRPMTPLERRYLRCAMVELRKFERRMILRVSLGGLFVDALFAAMLIGRIHMAWYWAVPLSTLFLLAVGVGSFRKELARLRRWRQSQIRAWQDGTALALRIQASAVVALEEIDDEGACYAFQTGDDEILFLRGQAFYPTARFPNADFALVRLIDDPQDDGVIAKFGRRLAPLRTVAAPFLWKLHEQPDHLDRAAGTLDALEAVLTAWPRDKLS
jgi:hypothetical protein